MLLVYIEFETFSIIKISDHDFETAEYASSLHSDYISQKKFSITKMFTKKRIDKPSAFKITIY